MVTWRTQPRDGWGDKRRAESQIILEERRRRRRRRLSATRQHTSDASRSTADAHVGGTVDRPTARLESLSNNGFAVKSSNAKHPPNDDQSAN